MAVGIIAIGVLYFARDIFVPLALAVLLSFALGPLVAMLRRRHLGLVPAVTIVVLVTFLVIFGVGTFIGGQLVDLAGNLPQYQSNIAAKIFSLRGTISKNGIVGRAEGMLHDLGKEVTGPPASGNPAAPAPTHAGRPQAPVPVEIHQPEPTPLQLVRTIVTPLLQPLATTGLVIVFVILFLLKREDLRDRFIRLAGARDLHRTTKGLNDAAHRLSRYLLAQTAINASFGVLICIGLWLIGVPNPVLWGILAMLLRFVPYIGSVIAAIFPATLAIAIDPGWSMLLSTVALFLVVEGIMGQFVEPYVYGHSTGLSAVAVIAAAAFWTWLWGPIGLLLSTPLTLCLVVLGRHVERLEFLDIILGNRPALTPEENFYQRMLANDPDEAADQAEEFLKQKSLAVYYDEVAIRGLALAQLDVNRGVLEHERRVLIKEGVLGVIDNLADHAHTLLADGADPSQDTVDPVAHPRVVLCVAGRGSLDEAAAAMLGQLLQAQGVTPRMVPSDAVVPANLYRLDLADVGMVFLSYLEPGGFTNARYLIRRLRRKLSRVEIIVGFWTLTDEDALRRDALQETGADRVVTSLRQATELAAQVPDRTAPGAELPVSQPRAEITSSAE
ncbi:MAG: AI-2E family transporter [Stellaceae bacterium]